MDLVLVTPADAERIRVCHGVSVAAEQADNPTEMPPWGIQTFGALIASGWIGDPRQTWMAADGSGYYQIELPEADNRHMARLELVVRPDRRRQGTGSALLNHATAVALKAGRTLITGGTWVDSPGESFARDAGYKAGLTEIRRVLRVGAVPPPVPVAGYSLVTWQGPTPEEYFGGVAAVSAAIADAPSDPSWEPEHWDLERVRLVDERIARQGLRGYTVAALHDATGEMAALTQVRVDPGRPGWGFQELTAVTRAHRGHRLGLAIKTALMRSLAEHEPTIKRIVTWNAEENKHMIAINEALGYEILGKPSRWFESVIEPEPA